MFLLLDRILTINVLMCYNSKNGRDSVLVISKLSLINYFLIVKKKKKKTFSQLIELTSYQCDKKKNLLAFQVQVRVIFNVYNNNHSSYNESIEIESSNKFLLV